MRLEKAEEKSMKIALLLFIHTTNSNFAVFDAFHTTTVQSYNHTKMRHLRTQNSPREEITIESICGPSGARNTEQTITKTAIAAKDCI